MAAGHDTSSCERREQRLEGRIDVCVRDDRRCAYQRDQRQVLPSSDRGARARSETGQVPASRTAATGANRMAVPREAPVPVSSAGASFDAAQGQRGEEHAQVKGERA